MFWRYNVITGSHIETLLDKEDVTLKELMDEDDILQECKAQTKKLLDFLVRPEILDEMITLITQDPSEEVEEKQRYKYSNIACELLTFDIGQINDAIASDETLLNKLYSFLESDGPLNPLLASFYSKTMALLISKKTELLLNFLKKKDFISLLLKHMDTSAIMDLLLRSVTSVESEVLRTSLIEWLDREYLIHRLIQLIDIGCKEECISNASHALCDIIRVSREHMSLLQEKAEPDLLLEEAESIEVVLHLLSNMFTDSTKESAIVNGIQVLLALLEFKKQKGSGVQQPSTNQSQQSSLQADVAPQSFVPPLLKNNGPEQMTSLDTERLSKCVDNVVTAVTVHLHDFHALLLKPPTKSIITLTTGCLDPPFGFCRLEVTRLLTALISVNNHRLNSKLASFDTITTLLDMFFKYSWNNFLHTQVEQAIGRIIFNSPTVDEEGNKVHPLLDQVLTKYKITVKILQCFEDDEKAPLKHGYMGHLTKIANHVAENSENGVNSELIKEKIKGLPKQHFEKWNDFVHGKLADINKRNITHSVGGPPLPSSSSDDTVDFREAPFAKDSSLHLAFTDYQMHEMTSNFVDQFGFNDDEFEDTDENLISYPRDQLGSNFQIDESENRSSELFEDICRSRVNKLWDDDKEPATPFVSMFRRRPPSDANSDSDDECQAVFEPGNNPIGLPDDFKVEVRRKKRFMAMIRPSPLSDSDSDSDDDCQAVFEPGDDSIVLPELKMDDKEPGAPFGPPLDDSDSDDECQKFFELDNHPIVLPLEEIKMDVDHQEALFGVPMDVAPISMNNPWESSEPANSASDDQGNWADFSNFASFGASTADSSDTADTSSIVMETLPIVTVSSTSSSATLTESCSSKISSQSDASEVKGTSEVIKCETPVELPDTETSIAKDNTTLTNIESKDRNRQKDMPSLFEEETSESSVQNGIV